VQRSPAPGSHGPRESGGADIAQAARNELPGRPSALFGRLDLPGQPGI